MTRSVALALVAASTAALAGCGGVIGARMTFDDVERGAITEIVLTGGSGDVRITTSTSAESRIKRVVRQGSDPGEPYRLSGTTVTLNTDCSHQCQVSYELTVPAGVRVRGKLGSGDLHLTRTGAIDLELTSGDVTVQEATGPVSIEAVSGDLTVTGGEGATTLQTRSGDLKALELRGPAEMRATSGDITVRLAVPASVTAATTSGDVRVNVPDGGYRVTARATSGDSKVTGLTEDPAATNVIDARATSGDVQVSGIR